MTPCSVISKKHSLKYGVYCFKTCSHLLLSEPSCIDSDESTIFHMFYVSCQPTMGNYVCKQYLMRDLRFCFSAARSTVHSLSQASIWRVQLQVNSSLAIGQAGCPNWAWLLLLLNHSGDWVLHWEDLFLLLCQQRLYIGKSKKPLDKSIIYLLSPRWTGPAITSLYGKHHLLHPFKHLKPPFKHLHNI